YILEDPRNEGNKLFLTAQESNLQGIGIMYRILNIKKLFSILEKHNFNNQSIVLKMVISDSFVKENNGVWILQFKNGKLSLDKSLSNYDLEVKIDIADFAPLIMGCVSFKKLVLYGLVRISSAKLIDQVDKLFYTPVPPQTIEQF
ncbi:MAG: sterol carrier protein domain-containing protein, partial [Candidatus Hodarchaeales archaeon]